MNLTAVFLLFSVVVHFARADCPVDENGDLVSPGAKDMCPDGKTPCPTLEERNPKDGTPAKDCPWVLELPFESDAAAKFEAEVGVAHNDVKASSGELSISSTILQTNLELYQKSLEAITKKYIAMLDNVHKGLKQEKDDLVHNEGLRITPMSSVTNQMEQLSKEGYSEHHPRDAEKVEEALMEETKHYLEEGGEGKFAQKEAAHLQTIQEENEQLAADKMGARASQEAAKKRGIIQSARSKQLNNMHKATLEQDAQP